MKLIWVVFIFLLVNSYKAQDIIGNVPMHRYVEREYLKDQISNGGHSSIRPYLKEDFHDTLTKEIALSSNDWFSIKALSDIELGIDKTTQAFNLAARGGAGIGLSGTVKNRLNVEANYLYNYVDGPSYIDSLTSDLGVSPGFGLATTVGDAFGYHQLQGYLHYKANKFFALQLGNGKNFIGDGYRSLLLSDVANNYPYFKITTGVWNIKYVNLFTRQRDIGRPGGNLASKFSGKFTATHYLDWSISKSVNLGLFESIVWQAQDTLLDRGFDLNYLNPIIFYRPVEYQQGSADNALMGINLSVNIAKKIKVYGQFVIDEFLLDEVKADSGWWANKYGAQIGLKAHDFVIEGLDFQTEYSSVRPYTYSHGASVQNYGHDNGSLAHPYGSNYREWLSFISYRKNKWIFEEQISLAVHGEDSISSVSYGGNIFQSYSNRPYNYGHFTGQGLKTSIFYSHLRISYLIHARSNIRAELGYVFRERKNGLEYESNHYVYVGLKTNLWNRYNDY